MKDFLVLKSSLQWKAFNNDFLKNVPVIIQHATKTMAFILIYIFHLEADCIIFWEK